MWTRSVYKPPYSADPAKRQIGEIKAVWSFNCDEGTTSTLSLHSYNPAGELIYSDSDATARRDVTPDSVGEHVMKLVCAK